MSGALDVEKLEQEVKSVYRQVANTPDNEFHFEMGRGLAERLGYPPEDLDEIPQESIDSFAGVGYHFDMADIQPGDRVLDLGSGSGMDVFVAALHAGDLGHVTGLDMTPEQLEKSRDLRDMADFTNVAFKHGYIEDLSFDDETFDVVISNGVINLSAEKEQVFDEVMRVLKPGGRLAVSDIISEKQMPDSIKGDADLWAACIGGAEQVEMYTEMVESSGLEVNRMRDNDMYEFTSDAAQSACSRYGVKSIGYLAFRP